MLGRAAGRAASGKEQGHNSVHTHTTCTLSLHHAFTCLSNQRCRYGLDYCPQEHCQDDRQVPSQHAALGGHLHERHRPPQGPHPAARDVDHRRRPAVDRPARGRCRQLHFRIHHSTWPGRSLGRCGYGHLPAPAAAARAAWPARQQLLLPADPGGDRGRRARRVQRHLRHHDSTPGERPHRHLQAVRVMAQLRCVCLSAGATAPLLSSSGSPCWQHALSHLPCHL